MFWLCTQIFHHQTLLKIHTRRKKKTQSYEFFIDLFPTFFNLAVDSLRRFYFYYTYKKLSHHEKLNKPEYCWLDMGGTKWESHAGCCLFGMNAAKKKTGSVELGEEMRFKHLLCWLKNENWKLLHRKCVRFHKLFNISSRFFDDLYPEELVHNPLGQFPIDIPP